MLSVSVPGRPSLAVSLAVSKFCTSVNGVIPSHQGSDGVAPFTYAGRFRMLLIGSTAAIVGIVLLFAGCITAATGGSLWESFFLFLLCSLFWIIASVVMGKDDQRDH